jgi:LytR cell envelope-related transcriptional attenuator
VPEIVQEIGAAAGLAAVVGIAVLSALYFSQARDLKRLREWAGRAPERAAEQAPQPGQPRVVPQPQPKTGAAQPIPGRATPAPGSPLAAATGARPAAATAAAQSKQAPAEAGPAGQGAPPEAAPVPKPGVPAPVGASAQGAAAAAGAAAVAAAQAAAAPSKPAEDAGGKPAEDAAGKADGGPAKIDQAAPPKPADGAPAKPEEAGPAEGAPARPAEAKPAGTVPAKPTEAEDKADAVPKPGVPATPAGARPAQPTRAAGAPPVPPRPTPSRPGGPRPTPSQTAILSPSEQARQPWYRRVSPRYLVLVVAGVLIIGGGAAFALAQLAQEEAPAPKAERTERFQGASTNQKKSKAPRVVPSQVTVSVLNGTTVPGLAAKVGDKVEGLGFQLGNVTNNSDQSRNESVVLYAPGHQREATAVGGKLGVGQREPIDAASQALAGDAGVVVIAGTDQI